MTKVIMCLKINWVSENQRVVDQWLVENICNPSKCHIIATQVSHDMTNDWQCSEKFGLLNISSWKVLKL